MAPSLTQLCESESLRLNSLSPRSRTNTSCDGFEKEDCSDRPRRRRWRRIIRHVGDDDKNHNFVERMRDAARKAKVFQLRIAGGRSWWPSSMHTSSLSSSTVRITAKSDYSYYSNHHHQRRQKHDESALKSTSTDQFDNKRNRTKTSTSSASKEQPLVPIQKQKFEWNNFWKTRSISSDIDECTVDLDTLQSSSNTAANNDTITNAVDDVQHDDLAIMEIAENIEKEEEEERKKKQQNVVVAAVATTSVSSIRVALAILLL
jgi:hypothetical protein